MSSRIHTVIMILQFFVLLLFTRFSTAFLPAGSSSSRIPSQPQPLIRTTILPKFTAITSNPQSYSPPTSRIHTRLYATNNNNNNNNNIQYSQATQDRLQGLDAAQEFAKLAQKLKTPPKDLVQVLNQKLSAINPNNSSDGLEKAEYINWLLSGSAGLIKPTQTNAKANGNTKSPTTKTKKKEIRIVTPKKPAVSVVDVSTPTTKAINKKSTTKTSTSTGTPGTSNSSPQQQTEQTFATEVLFENRHDLHPNSKRAVAKMGLTSMTEIQAKTFEAASLGRDVLGRARTGTGKTVAFLLPAMERILQLGVHQEQQQIGILVVSPTRELATQIGDQAEKLAFFHRDMSVQVMFGGTNMKTDVARLTKRLPTILVATPGRLLDHMQSTRIGNQQFGKDIMSQTPIVVLDETDRLLDMGFRREITKILGYLPRLPQERQTLLFSATIPPDLKIIMAQNMNKDYIEVDCINDGDAATQTNAQVQQSHVIIPAANSDRAVSSVIEVVRHALEKYDNNGDAKIVVFFPTARLVNFYAELFNEGNILSSSIPVLELHSKKSQPYRNRVSEEFRKLKRGVLFTSDVSARGVDYPNVPHVIQFGMPESREQYIHRLGRTGRAGTEGKGWLVLSEWESLFLQELKGVDIPVNDELRDLISNPILPESQELLENVRTRIANNDRVLSKSAKGAYQAFLGYYLGQMRRMRMQRKEQLVDIANDFAVLSGLHEPPALTKQMVGKMGLKGISGLNVSAGQDREGGGGRNNSHNQGGPGHIDGRRAPGRGGRGGGRGGGRRRG